MNKFLPLYPLVGFVTSGICMGTLFSIFKLNESLKIRNKEYNNLPK